MWVREPPEVQYPGSRYEGVQTLVLFAGGTGLSHKTRAVPPYRDMPTQDLGVALLLIYLASALGPLLLLVCSLLLLKGGPFSLEGGMILLEGGVILLEGGLALLEGDSSLLDGDLSLLEGVLSFLDGGQTLLKRSQRLLTCGLLPLVVLVVDVRTRLGALVAALEDLGLGLEVVAGTAAGGVDVGGSVAVV